MDVFDLYRASLPVTHSQRITSVPSLGMQFANDCDWLATQVAQHFHDQALARITWGHYRTLAETVRMEQIVR